MKIMPEYLMYFHLYPSQEMCTVEEPNEEFTSRHSLEWKFLFLDHRYALHYNLNTKYIFGFTDVSFIKGTLTPVWSHSGAD